MAPLGTLWGSPPRVRGIPLQGMDEARKVGITPACAGNTNVAFLIELEGEDHPRVCGEYLVSLTTAQTKWGSPPRVRGIHHLIYKKNRVIRITPACAGNTGTLVVWQLRM